MWPVVIVGLLMLGTVGAVEVKNHPALLSPIQSEEVFELGNALGVAASAIDTYAHLPRCGSGACHNPATLRELDADLHAANDAYGALASYVQATPKGTKLSWGDLFTNAQGAIAVLQQAVADYHLAKGN